MYHSLKRNEQITQVTNKLRKIMYVFKNLADILDYKKLKIVYKVLVESMKHYGISV